MEWIVLVSVLMLAVATVWSLALARWVRDPRMLIPSLVLALLTVRECLRFAEHLAMGPGGNGGPTAHDFLGLAIGVAAMAAVPNLGRMIAARRRAFGDLELSEARMRQVLDLVPHMIFAKDWNANFLLANKALAEAYGTTVENIVGVSESTFQGPKEELDHFVADDRAVMSSGTLKFIPEETFTDITGKAHILETTKIPFTASATGERAVLGIAVDITARKQAEHRLQLTLAELDHRVKNTLALVQAVAEQAATKTDSVENFLADFRARTMALARIHDALRCERWSGVALRDLVDLCVAPYRHDSGRMIQCAGPDTHIGAEKVQPFGMALHELATNAAKYGALSDPGGHVAVTWTMESDAEGARVRLLWRESGGPPVHPPTKRGLGLSLIESGVPHEIGGEAHVEFAPDGVRATIVIPLKGG